MPERHLDNRGRCTCIASSSDQSLRDVFDRVNSHQENHCGNLTERAEINIAIIAVAKMAGHNGNGRREVAMRNRDSGAERRRKSRGYPRNDVKTHAVFCQVFRFFSAPAKQKWIAALQTDHHLAFLRLMHKQLVDFILTRVVPPNRFAHVNAFSGGLSQRQHIFLNQAVIDNDIRRLDQVCRFDRQ